jgi:NADH:ubiquinone oxidoreductase subunit F (NADH-binding)
MGTTLRHAFGAALAHDLESRRKMSAPPPPAAQLERHGTRQMPAGLPRLLAGMAADGFMSLSAHLALHGALPTYPRRRRGAEHGLITQIDHAGLRGRGGAGFPTERKMRAVASSRRRPVIVVNAAEGEPASLKDRTLTQSLPHLVLDGATLAAHALGADEVILAVCASAPASIDSLAAAIHERRARGGGSPGIQLSTVPTHYLAGQESALVNHLNGASAIPTSTPPMVFQRGVERRPTHVGNAETFAHIALIARHGPDWFRELGTRSQPGSTLLTLSGPVRRPGVYEIAYGARLGSVIDAAGGVTRPVRAALIGGYGGSWVGAEQLHGLVLADEYLAAHGAFLGAGVLLLLSEDACPVAETTRLTRWLAEQSAGQCGPCVHGLNAIATSLESAMAGGAPSDPNQQLTRLAGLVRGRGACRHPDGASQLLLSAIQVFSAELADHARHGPCEACFASSELPLPSARPPRAATGKPLRRAAADYEPVTLR